ncbi:MAG: trypsin-like serine protease [Bacteroidia bacterium]|jgi:hypothetical protein
MNRKNTFLIGIALLAFLTGFSGIIRHDVPEESYRNLAQQPQFECVGQVYKDTQALGSCVFIGDRFLLTAAHLFIESVTIPDTLIAKQYTRISHTVSSQRVASASRFIIVIKGQKLGIKRITIHPYYLNPLTKGSCDLAVIELEEPLLKVVAASTNSFFNELHSDVAGVGFGVSGIADKPEGVGPHELKIAGENVIDSIGGMHFKGNETLLYCDFDHPTRTDCNKLGSSTPKPLEYISSGGDSGGGLFRKVNNNWQLIGICSGSGIDVNQLLKAGYYGQTMQWTRVSVFKEWITEQIK